MKGQNPKYQSSLTLRLCYSNPLPPVVFAVCSFSLVSSASVSNCSIYYYVCSFYLFPTHWLACASVSPRLLGLCCNGIQNLVFSFRLKLAWVFLWPCYSLCLILFHNQHSSVYDQSVGWTILFSVSSRCKRFFSSPKYSHLSWGPPWDSSDGIATCYGLDSPEINPDGGEIFCTYPGRLCGPPNLL
jgi:hypothetical protein